MSIYTAIMTFVIVAWVIFFILLPIKNHFSNHFIQGQAKSAPEKAHLWIKAGMACILAAVITWIIFLWVG